MKKGRLVSYNENKYMIETFHPNFETIPQDEQLKCDDWVVLPDDYKHLSGIMLLDKITGEITNIPTGSAPPTSPTFQDLKVKLSQVEDMLLYLIIN